jgi:DNA-binding NarL/FixJ family response regulator
MAEGPRPSECRVGVFIIAENRLLREALTRILSKKTDICISGAAQFAPETIQQISDSDAEMLLVNPAAPLALEPGYLLELRSLATRFKLVLVGMEEDGQSFLWAVRAGVLGYALKDAAAADVVAAVRAAARGDATCPPSLLRYLFSYFGQQWSEIPNGRVRSHLGLSRREQQLVPLIARGLTNKEIAAHLNLSEQTVKNHIHRVLQKVGATDRLTIVEACRELGLAV